MHSSESQSGMINLGESELEIIYKHKGTEEHCNRQYIESHSKSRSHAGHFVYLCYFLIIVIFCMWENGRS